MMSAHYWVAKLLSEWNQRVILFSVSANRPNIQYEKTIGMFVNLVSFVYETDELDSFKTTYFDSLKRGFVPLEMVYFKRPQVVITGDGHYRHASCLDGIYNVRYDWHIDVYAADDTTDEVVIDWQFRDVRNAGMIAELADKLVCLA